MTNALAILSPLLCVAIGVVWIRSWSIYDGADRETLHVIEPGYGRYRSIGLQSARGAVTVTYYSLVGGIDTGAPLEAGWRWSGTPRAGIDPRPPAWRDWWFSAYFSDTIRPPRLPFDPRGAKTRMISVGVPYWCLLLIGATVPVWRLARLLGRQRRNKRGQCTHCGYDLRGVSGRCPECGTPVSHRPEDMKSPHSIMRNSLLLVAVSIASVLMGCGSVTIGAEYRDDSDPNNPTYTYQTTLVKNVVVADVTPTVSVRGNTTATVVGDAYTLLPAFTDAGSGDTPRQWTVAWGDGSSSAYFGDIGNVSHVYTSANATSGTVYSPSLTVITDDGTYSASTSVTIGQPVMNVIQGDGTPMNHDDQHDMGAFIVINNDDDLGNYDSNGNPIPDLSYTTPQSYADPDLVQVTLQPLPSAVGGTYTLSWDTNDFRVWTDPYKDSQLTSGATFSATAGHSVYLEAIAAPLGNSDILEEDWHGGPGGALAVAMVDHAKLKTLTVSGPQNVPAYGTYSYSVSGGVPHNKANSWKVTDGVTTGTSALDSKTLVQWTKANAGTAGWVGKADFIIAEKAANYEVHAMSPNVVNISIAAPPGGEFSAGTPTDGGTFVKGNLRRKQVWSGDQTATPKQPGLAWGAVVTLNGPNNNTGVDRIKVGFIQNITGFIHHGTYKAGNQFITARSKVEGATLTPPGLDEVDGAQRPWYSTAAGNTFQPARGGNPTGPISSSDMPFDGPPLSWTAGRLAGQLMHMNLQYSFALYIAAQSQDAAGSKVYVGQYKGNWVFNGDGTIKNDQGWTWTKDGTAKVTPPTDWGQQLTTGESPVISGETLNSFLHVEPFQ